VRRAERNKDYIDMLIDELSHFNNKLQTMIAHIRAYDQRAAA